MQLVFFTQDPYRAGKVEQAVADQGWGLVTAIAQSRPQEWLRLRTADVIILDLDVPDALGLVERFARSYPAVPLLALAGPDKLVDLQQALLVGAVAFVLFPFDARQLVAAVQGVLRQSGIRVAVGAGKVSSLVAVTGLKGGVGRTTVATNLAVTLATRHPDDVILVEAHGGLSDAALLLNIRPQRTLASLGGELRLDTDVIQGHLKSHSSSLRVLAAPTSLSLRVDIPPETWRSVLVLLKGMASYVIVDTGATPDAVLSEVLMASSDILVLAIPDMPALRASVSLYETLRRDPGINAPLHLVLNREGISGGVSTKSVNNRFGYDVDAVLVDDPSLTMYAANRGEPFVLTHPRALLSRQLGLLADRLALGAGGSEQAAAAAADPTKAGGTSTAPAAKRKGILSLRKQTA